MRQSREALLIPALSIESLPGYLVLENFNPCLIECDYDYLDRW